MNVVIETVLTLRGKNLEREDRKKQVNRERGNASGRFQDGVERKEGGREGGREGWLKWRDGWRD